MDEHPFRRAWRTRNVGAWSESLAPDVILRSPLLRTPFRGKAEAAELYEVLFQSFGRFEITHELAGEDTTSFFWRAEIGGRTIEGCDLVRESSDGKVAEVSVMIRPLVDLATFASAVGPPLARRRGRVRGAIAVVLSAPLRGLLSVVDAAATRLLQRRTR